jgi:multiple sugar transport system substrate-binding protein
MIAAGNPPDLVRAYGATQSPYYAQRGISLNLDNYLAKSNVLKTSDLASVNDVWRWNGGEQGKGSYYGLVKDWSQDLMYWYNESMFQAAGIALPTADNPLTYDHLLEIAKPMTKRSGGKVTQYGLFGTTPTTTMIAGMVATAGGRLYGDDLKTVDFTSPEARQALKWFIDVAQAKVGYSLIDVNPQGWDWPGYSANREAMAAAGYWMTGLFTPDQKTTKVSGLASAPLMGSTRVSPTTAGTGYWISAKSSMKDEAFAFLEWYCGGTPAEDRAKSGTGLPCLTSLQGKLPQETALQKQAFETQTTELKYFSVTPTTPYIDPSGIDATLSAAFAKAVSGSLSVGQYADTVTTAANALIANGVKLARK